MQAKHSSNGTVIAISSPSDVDFAYYRFWFLGANSQIASHCLSNSKNFF